MMKVEPTITITLSGRTPMRALLDGIKKGAEVQARVVERTGGRDAVIEIGGRKIHARFLKGVPQGGTLTLKLDAVSGDSYYFKLAPSETREAFIRRVMEMTVFDAGLLRKSLMPALGAALGKHPAGIFELNALLLNRPLRGTKEDGLARLLTRLARRGLDRNALGDLSLLLSGLSGGSKALRSLLLVLGSGEERLRRLAAGGDGGARSMIDAVIGEIRSIDDPEARDDAIRNILEFLSGDGAPREGCRAGEFAVDDGGDFHPARFMEAENAWLFSVDFSGIGRIEIVAREMEKEILISVFAEREEALEQLKKKAGELAHRLEHIHPNIYINFFNTQQAINKIVEIYSYFSLNSEFDIKA